VKSVAEIAAEFSKFGKEAVEHMAELLDRTPEEFRPSVTRFSKATAEMVPEFKGQDPEARYDCPECLDKGFVIVQEWARLYRREVERVLGCQRCHRGLKWEAAMWLDVVAPKGEKGKRKDSEEGWREFSKAFREKIRRRELVVAQIRAFQGQMREPGEGE
jgi:hypothetical protein